MKTCDNCSKSQQCKEIQSEIDRIIRQRIQDISYVSGSPARIAKDCDKYDFSKAMNDGLIRRRKESHE